ncbi:MAG: hypothetical protein PVF58_14200 [Candidatus Methanofastidiosia archaeon]|jgi:hypothetical protein
MSKERAINWLKERKESSTVKFEGSDTIEVEPELMLLGSWYTYDDVITLIEKETPLGRELEKAINRYLIAKKAGGELSD